MILLESVAESFRGLREQRARTAVTLLGFTWGTFSVVLLLAVGTGLQTHFRRKAANFGRGIAIAWGQRTTKSYEGLGRGRRVRIRGKDVIALKERIPELEAVSPEYVYREQIRAGARIHRVTVAGVYPPYGELRTMKPLPGGRFLNDRDLAGKRRVAFIGNRVAKALYADVPAVGQRILLRGIPFTVVGALSPKIQDSDYDGLDENRVCIPATTHAQIFGQEYVSNFVYRARSAALHAKATDRIYEALGRACGFDPTDRAALYIWDTLEEQRLLSYVFLSFNLLLGGSGALTLLVGAIGVANLMFIRVRQRTCEIGIQMAVGARPGRILRMVLGETLILVAVGGTLGFGLAWGITELVSASALTEYIGRPEISILVALPTIALLAVTGSAAGLFPARRAARLHPVDALAET